MEATSETPKTTSSLLLQVKDEPNQPISAGSNEIRFRKLQSVQTVESDNGKPSLPCKISLRMLPTATVEHLKGLSSNGTLDHEHITGANQSQMQHSNANSNVKQVVSSESPLGERTTPDAHRQKASQLKRVGDHLFGDGQVIMSACAYLESAMNFIKFGNELIDLPHVDTAVGVLDDTLKIFDTIERNFWKSKQPTSYPKIYESLVKGFTYKCQAVLYSFIYQLRCVSLTYILSTGNEVRQYNQDLRDFLSKNAAGQSSEPPVYPLPAAEYFVKTLYLFNGHNRKKEADELIKEIKEYRIEGSDFFDNIERDCGALALQGGLDQLIAYMQYGIPKLQQIFVNYEKSMLSDH